MNGTSFDPNPGPFGAGPFAWRANQRPKGAPTRWVNRPLDYQLIERAKELLPSKLTVGAALRTSVEKALRDGRFGRAVEVESVVKRLRRMADRRRLFEP